MHVEVEQRGLALVLAGEIGQRTDDGRRAHAAARADHAHHDVCTIVLLRLLGCVEHGLSCGQGIAHRVDVEWLEQIVLNAAAEQVAIEAHVIDLAARDHDSAGLADLGEGIDVVQRIARFGQVDEQHVRARRHRKRLDGIAQTALVDALDRPAQLLRDDAQQIEAMLIAHIGLEGIAAPDRCFKRCVHFTCPLRT